MLLYFQSSHCVATIQADPVLQRCGMKMIVFLLNYIIGLYHIGKYSKNT